MNGVVFPNGARPLGFVGDVAAQRDRQTARGHRFRTACTVLAAATLMSYAAACSTPTSIDEARCHEGAETLDVLMAKVAIAGVAHDRQRACALIPDGWTFTDDSLRKFGKKLNGNADIDWVAGEVQGPMTTYTLLDPSGTELAEVPVVAAANGRFFALLGSEPTG